LHSSLANIEIQTQHDKHGQQKYNQ